MITKMVRNVKVATCGTAATANPCQCRPGLDGLSSPGEGLVDDESGGFQGASFECGLVVWSACDILFC